MEKKIYMSVEEGFEKTPEELYRSSKKIIPQLSDIADVVLVHPRDYDLKNQTINAGYSWDGKSENLTKIIGEHHPHGNIFLVYGDETSKNIGIDFARNQYEFLRQLQQNKNFDYFINTPDAEEMTLKDSLVELCKDQNLQIANTIYYKNNETAEKFLKKYGSAIIKPIFGCRMAGVNKINSMDDLLKLNLEEGSDYILQEPLVGPETRIVLLGDDFLCSRIHYSRKTPWGQDNPQKTYSHHPSKKELEISYAIKDKISTDLIGVDFIGHKVNEVNGTGTGIKIFDHNYEELYDKTPQFVDFVNQKLEQYSK